MHVEIRYSFKSSEGGSYKITEVRGYILGVFVNENKMPCIMFTSENGLVFSIKQRISLLVSRYKKFVTPQKFGFYIIYILFF